MLREEGRERIRKPMPLENHRIDEENNSQLSLILKNVGRRDFEYINFDSLCVTNRPYDVRYFRRVFGYQQVKNCS